MGYTTDFSGSLSFDKPIAKHHADYLNAFSATRRMQRKPDVAETFSDPLRIAAGLPIGKEGGYYVGDTDDHGQGHDASIVNYNHPPKGQPGLWCQWIVGENADGDTIEWDGSEKFYNYTEWLQYIIDNFIKPWGYKLNGEIFWTGEDSSDLGQIVVVDNVVTIKEGKVIYE